MNLATADQQPALARAWAELMRRLGYARYVAQGGDQGAAVTDAMGRQAPNGLIGIHLNFLREALGDVSGMPADSEEERAAQLDRAGLPQPDPLQPRRTRRPLRRLGATATVL